ncbi:oligosaccharide flippase family protein [Kerstersia gyiorum]|uniref:oligosaccharide flippase family protein n=1 Tax=Kerstersia gyiorum TaxID=206506 RepID=UPI0039E7B568
MASKRSGFFKNFSSLASIQLINYLAPIIVLPILAIRLGADNIGILGLATAVSAYVLTVTDYGFSYSGTKEISQLAGDAECVEHIYSEIIVAKFLLFFVAVLFLAALSIWVPVFKNNILLIFLGVLYIPGGILFAEFLFLGIERMEQLAKLNLIVKILSSVLVVFFVGGPEDVWVVPVVNAIAYWFSGLAGLYLAKRMGYRLLCSKAHVLSALRRIRFGWNVFLSIFLPNLYNNLSTILLSMYAPLSVVGVFDIAKKIITVPEQLFTIYSRVFFPILSRNISRHRQYFCVGLLAGLGCWMGFHYLSQPFIDYFFGEEYQRAGILLRYFGIAPLLLFLSSAWGTGYLYIKGHEQALRNIVGVASILAFFLALFVIPVYKDVGVVVTILVARFLMSAGSMVFVKIKKV